MSRQFPSIQSFFSSPQTAPSSRPLASSATEPGDGFTPQEVDAALHPQPTAWSPPHAYSERSIGELEPGPGSVMFIGRVRSLYDQATPSKQPLAAQGCLKMTVGDDTGTVTVFCIAATACSATNPRPDLAPVRQQSVRAASRPAGQRVGGVRLAQLARLASTARRGLFRQRLPRARPELPRADPRRGGRRDYAALSDAGWLPRAAIVARPHDTEELCRRRVRGRPLQDPRVRAEHRSPEAL